MAPAFGAIVVLLTLLLIARDGTAWAAKKKAIRTPPPATATRPAPVVPTTPPATGPAGADPGNPAADPSPETSAEGLEDRVREMLAAGRLEEAGAEIDRRLAGLPDPGPLRVRLAALLAGTARPLLAAAPAADWPASAAAPLEGTWRKARDLDPEQVSYWLSYLDCLARQPGTEAALTFEGQDLLDRHGAALRRQPPAGQIKLLQRLGKIFDLRGFPLHRLEILQILARHPATASEANRLLPLARETIKLRAAELLERIEAAMVMNELDQAKNLLERLRAAQPDLPQLARLTTRLDTVRKVQSLLTEASIALQRHDTPQVKRLCDQALELDPNNPNARAYLAQIAAPTASATPQAKRAVDPRAARKADLLGRLARAAQDEDLAESRRLLKELIAQGFAAEEHFRQLAAIDKELAQGRLFAPERFDDARRLMDAGKWPELHRFLNRNPALGDSLERIMAVWDMRLAAAFFTGSKDDQDLLADADRIAAKNPKSFWCPFVRMRIALRRNEMAEAEKQLGLARAISPDHKLLSWWGRLLWVWRHGWKIVPIVLLAFFYLAAKGMFWFLHLWENGYWTRTAWIGRLLPRLALASLERRFGTVKEDWARLRMFELLTQYAFACGEKEKGIRYAELLLELKAQHPLAMQLLGRHYLSAPLKPPQTGFLLTYIKLFPDDKDALAKVGTFLLATNQLTGDHLDLARRYMNAFPQDQDMVVAVGQMLDGADVLSVSGETLEIMEKAWRVSNRDALWWSLWRALVVKGNHDRALTLLAEALQAGRPIDPVQLPDVLESQLDPVVMTLQRDITGLDKTAAAAALARLSNLKFLTARQADLLLPYLDGSVNDDDPGVRYAAQKARDHVHKAAAQTAEFVARLRAIPPPTGAQIAQAADTPGAGDAAPASEAVTPAPAASPATRPATRPRSGRAAPPVASPSREEPTLISVEPGPGDVLPPLPLETEPGDGTFPPLGSGESAADPDNPLSGLPFLASESAEAPEQGGFPTLPPAGPGFPAGTDFPAAEPSAGDAATTIPSLPETSPPPPEPDDWTASAPPAQAQMSAPALPQRHRQFDDLDAFAPPPEAPFHAPHPIRTLFTDLPGPAPAATWPAPPSAEAHPAPIPGHHPAPTPRPPSDAPTSEPSSTPPTADLLPGLAADRPQPADTLPDGQLPTPEAGDSQIPAEPLSTNSARIDALPENPSLGELAPLLTDTTVADLPAWDAFLRRPPGLRCLEVLVRSLGQLHAPEVVPVLRPFLQHPIPRVRANAIEGLTDNGDPSVIPFLVPFLRDEDNRIRANAIKALSDFGVKSILEELRKMVEDDRARMRDSATWVLKGLRGREAADLLHRLLGDPEPGIRQNAIRSLAQQGDPSNADALRSFLDGNPDAEEATLARKALDYIQQKHS